MQPLDFAQEQSPAAYINCDLYVRDARDLTSVSSTVEIVSLLDLVSIWAGSDEKRRLSTPL